MGLPKAHVIRILKERSIGMINLSCDYWHDFRKVGTMGDIRQHFKPKTLHLKARLSASVSMATIHAIDKQLKARNTKATNHRGPYIKVSDEEREAMLLSMESLLL